METIHVEAVIAPDGKMRLEVPCSSPPGPAEVVVIIAPKVPAEKKTSWRDLYGLGKEIWEGIDAQEYVNKLRDEWER